MTDPADKPAPIAYHCPTVDVASDAEAEGAISEKVVAGYRLTARAALKSKPGITRLYFERAFELPPKQAP